MKKGSKVVGSVVLASLLALGVTGCNSSGGNNDSTTQTSSSSSIQTQTEITAKQKLATLTTYADIALANYTDAYNDAVALKRAIEIFTNNPTEETLEAAKRAWLKSRESYGTTEVFRFSNGPIDAEEGFATKWDAPEPQINAWPLDENMIDYTIAANGEVTRGNIIDTRGRFTPNGGTAVDVTTITKETLAKLNENGGEANVATGYHAIEFLLWGQDQDYNDFTADTITHGPTTAGQRPLSDYTTDENADRRKAYLKAAADLLVDDLGKMVDAWSDKPGSYREALLGKGENAIPADTALRQIFSGMGVFIKSELANERMAVAIHTPSEEDEHSCFSDNTHRDVDTNYRGFVNVLKGEYKGVSRGTSFYSLLANDTKESIDSSIDKINEKVETMNNAVSGEHFDYQIKPDSENRSNLINLKNSLRTLGDKMVDVASDFDIKLTTSDVTDPEETEI